MEEKIFCHSLDNDITIHSSQELRLILFTADNASTFHFSEELMLMLFSHTQKFTLIVSSVYVPVNELLL